MSQTPSAPCPHCRAKNFTYRRLCWKCTRTLPTSFALESTRAYSSAQPIAKSTTSSQVATAPIAEKSSIRENTVARAEFRELVRGLLEKCGA